MKVEIMEWEKFNPRTDRKSHAWFRLQNSFFKKTRKWTADQQRLFLYLCGEQSENKDKSKFNLDIEVAAFFLGMKQQKIQKDLQWLVQIGRIKMEETPSGNQSVTGDVPSGVPTNERNERTNEQASAFDFDRLYEKYPRKIGKKKGIEICERTILTQEGYESLESAIQNYNAYTRRERTDPKFIKHFSTFMSCWTDWAEPIADQPTARGSPPLDTLEKIKHHENEVEKQCTLDPSRVHELIARARKPIVDKPDGPGAA